MLAFTMEEKFSKPGVGCVHFVPAKTEVGLMPAQQPIIVVHFLHMHGICHFLSIVVTIFCCKKSDHVDECKRGFEGYMGTRLT